MTAINKMVCMIRRIKQCKITFCKTTKRNRNETVGNQFESGEFQTYIGIEKIGSRFMHLRNHEVKNVWQFPPVEDVHIFSWYIVGSILAQGTVKGIHWVYGHCCCSWINMFHPNSVRKSANCIYIYIKNEWTAFFLLRFTKICGYPPMGWPDPNTLGPQGPWITFCDF